MPATDSRETLRFRDFELDLAAYQLRRNGHPVRLERQPMDLLILLVERRSQLLSHSDIVDRLWGKDVFVDVETGVHTAIRKVRQALSDSPEAPTCVETVPGKGYRFIAPVEILPTLRTGARRFRGARATSTRRRSSRPGTARGRAAAPASARGSGAARRPSPPRVTVAVLPFENLSGDAERRVPRRRPGRGDHRVVRTDRSRPPQRHRPHLDPGLQAHPEVAGRDRPRAGRRLPDGGVDPSGGYGAAHHVAPGARARPDAGVVGVLRSAADQPCSDCKGRSARRSPSKIQLRLSPERLDALARRHTRQCRCVRPVPAGPVPVESAQARDQRPGDRVLRAGDRARPGLRARVVRHRQRPGGQPDQQRRAPPRSRARAREAAARAVRADPRLAEAQTSLGIIAFYLDWDWPAAEAALRRAIALDPGYDVAHRYLAHVLSQSGRQDEARAIILRARGLDPFYAMNHAMSSQVAFQARDYPAAVQHARQAIVVDPGFWIGHIVLGQAEEQLGQARPCVRSVPGCGPPLERQHQDDGLQGPRPRPAGAHGRGPRRPEDARIPVERAVRPRIPSRSCTRAWASGTRPLSRSTAPTRRATSIWSSCPSIPDGTPTGRSPVQGSRGALRLRESGTVVNAGDLLVPRGGQRIRPRRAMRAPPSPVRWRRARRRARV